MIFAVIGEELGLVGAAALILAYAAFTWAGLKVALECKDPFGKRLAAGVTTLVSGQAAINLAAVLGLAPLTGIPLPLVSYGGSSLVVALLSVGILLNIARGNGGRQTAAVPDRDRRDRGARRPVAGRGGSAASARRGSDVRRVAGFPRRPGPGLLRALGLSLAAPAACWRILGRRRPDVVLGGGGYVAGPMVLA